MTLRLVRGFPFLLAFAFAIVACGDARSPSAPAGVSSARSAAQMSEAPSASQDPSAPIVHVDSGLVRGRANDLGAQFRGIPYAAPPIGELRWRPPARVAPWSGVREATGFGPVCVQSPSSYEPKGTPMGSEDCLSLNVFTPNRHPESLFPVLVFVHGGFFSWGSSSKRVEGEPIYDGEILAKNIGAVVVTLNYRLGPLGFIAHPALDKEDPHGASGNYGLQDQIAALEWVARNIGAFGGDKSNVTLSGHSAGAISTVVLASSPLAKGLFSRAIAFSGSGWVRPRKRAEELGDSLSHLLGCDRASDVLACMRSRSADDVVGAMPEAFAKGDGFAPNVDGYLVPKTPIEAYLTKSAPAVPIMIGTTSDEFSTMAHTIVKKAPANDDEVKALLAPAFGAKIPDAAIGHYPRSSYASSIDQLVHIWSDAAIVCPNRILARSIAYAEPAHVWRFIFTHSYTPPEIHMLGAGHGLELPLLFRDLPEMFKMSPPETAMADSFTDVIARFVKTGDPNGGETAWPAYDARTDSYLNVDTPLAMKAGARSEQCDFWEATWKAR